MTATTKRPDSNLLAIRVRPDMLAALDALARKESKPGLDVTRTDAMRMALVTGLTALGFLPAGGAAAQPAAPRGGSAAAAAPKTAAAPRRPRRAR